MSDAIARRPALSSEAKRALAAQLLRQKASRDPSGTLAHRLFEAQVARTPEAAALTFEGSTLTYRELDRRANRLAHHLRALGVGVEDRVGLCLERSPAMVVALLAVLKAGGAYVPLDPAYPQDRLDFMVRDARLAALVTEEGLRRALDPGDASVILLGAEGHLPEGPWPETSPGGGAGPDHLAYVIYTSGSTGRPKGVMIPHAALANFLAAMRHALGVTRSDALLAVTTLSFDIAALELLLPLATGARVVLAGRAVAGDGVALAALLESSAATLLQATPATWRMLLEAGWGGRPGLVMLCGGEALPRELADRLLACGGVGRLWNLYGPTEATVWATAAHVEPGAGPVAIGRPIEGLRAYVLDGRLRPVPVGVAGELYLGGVGLARGYLGRPGLTAERFVPDPFGAAGARLYRTGDRARWLGDGRLECLGRVDHQVKVRGHRVELGEVEAALGRHPGVRRAAATTWADGSGEQRLVGYVVAEPGAEGEVGGESLRTSLRESLPDYMVPSIFVALPALPLTPNGKVDRNALPAPEGGGVEPGRAYAPPRTPTEEVVAGLWAEVLGLERVGALDDFFELGGHSLLATRLISRLRDAFSVEVPLSALFEAPTVEGLARRVEEARRGGRESAMPPIGPARRDGELPLSFAQQALWFIDQLAPGQPTFNVTAAVRITGPLDLEALGRSFAEMLRRHEALRTVFAEEDGRPVQVVTPAGEMRVPLEIRDLRDLPDGPRAGEARRLAVEALRQPFDLARGPLIRARLLRLGDAENAVILGMHHIITDGWSFSIATRELAALYESFRAGGSSPLPELPIQYADYAAWQRDRLSGDWLDELVGYWSRQLAGASHLELPTDRPRPAVRTANGSTRGVALPAELLRDLQALSRREGSTLFMTLLAAFQALLHRYSGQDDIVVGSPIANRTQSETEGLIGYFVNMLALRTDFSGDPAFREILRRVRKIALEAYEHQELPLEKVVEAVRPPRDPSRTPLFQVMFVLQNNAAMDLENPDLTFSGLDVGEEAGTAKFDLTLGLGETPEGLVGAMEYNTDLFDAATIDRMLGQFQTLLRAVVADPARRVSELPILPEDERRRLLVEWSGTRADDPVDRCVHQLVEAQAARTPDAVAVVCGDQCLTYQELDTRANRLAHHLRSRGVGPDVIVGIGLDRSPELAVGLLSILKAGGAFLPLDPDYPRDRLAFMLEDAEVPMLLTRERLRHGWPAGGFDVICLDTDWEVIGEEPGERADGGARPENAAYVIYTSGSTGRPRGVVVPHRAAVNHHTEVVRLFDLGPGERMLQFSSLGFDGAIEEIFPAWIAGASVVFRGEEILDPIRFSRWVGEESINVVDLPTAYWHEWTNGLAGTGEPLPESLRLVVVGGEKASAAVLARWQALAAGRVRWMNTYGPTEATIIASAFEETGRRDDGGCAVEVPIGRPIANTRLYVLDAGMRPAPVGVPGELYIGGDGVARGYLRRPGLTAERFVPDPFGPPGGRLYRTGDRARWRPDATLEYLGRADDQVKVRGHRVEPGEVEAALARHPAVREAAVVAREDTHGDRRLVAYVVTDPARPVPSTDLHRFLQGELPRPMIPSAIVPLTAMPLTPGGKVDRKALPAPDPGGSGREREVVGARDDVEARLVAIWEELLGVRPIGVTDEFFELGGHSLLAVRLMARIEERLGRRLPLATLFRSGTIEAIADLLRAEGRTTPRSPLVAIRADGSGRPLFLVHPVGGNVLCYRELTRALDPDRPVYGFQAVGHDAGTEPDSVLEEMATRYLEVMREVQPHGPYLLGGWSLGGVIAFEMAQQLIRQGREVASLVLIDSSLPRPGARSAAIEEAGILAAFAADLARGLGLPGDVTAMAGFTGFDAVARMAPNLDPDYLRHLYRTFRANVLARARYEPRPYPGRLIFFHAGDPDAALPEDPTLGWGEFALGGVSAHVVPGDHYTIVQPPAVGLVAGRLESEIGAAR